MTPHKLLPVTLALAALVPAGAASAAVQHPSGTAAMKKGIHTAGRISAHHARVSKVAISCPDIGHVGRRAACHGTFRLTRDGVSATYRLNRHNHVLRISPHAIEYRVAATAIDRGHGLPAHIDLAGFLQ